MKTIKYILSKLPTGAVAPDRGRTVFFNPDAVIESQAGYHL